MKSEHSQEKKARGRIAGSFRTRSFRVGGYSVIAAAIVIAIAVVVNVVAGSLPSTFTQLDITSNKLYSLSEQSQQIVSNLDEDVTIYWVVQSGKEDSGVEYMLNRYKALSSHVTVEKLDPDVYPTFIQQYLSTGDTLYNNSLVVVTADDYRYISYADIYVVEYDYSTYYTTGSLSYSTTWNGEREVTSAINILTSGEASVIYTLTGHGESSLDSSLTDDMEKENEKVESLSLLTVEEVPEDASCLMIYAPQSDLSEEETEKIEAWLQTGGNLIVLTDPLYSGETLPNLEALMADYGMEAQPGFVIEGNANYYLSGYPFYLLPAKTSHEITDPLIDGGYYVLLPIAQGLTVSDSLRDGLTVTKLLTTSSDSFSKVAGYNLTTYEKEADDIDGPFSVALAASETNADGSEAKVLWVSSSYLLDSSFNEAVSGGNEDFFLNSVSWMCGETDSISIRAKSLDTNYLTVPSGTATVLAAFLVVILPVAYLCIGIVTWVRRKRQ